MRITQSDRKIKRLETRVKQIEDILELSPVVTSFNYKRIEDVDKKILKVLLGKDRNGATTTEIADDLGFSDPENSGRVTVYRRLKRIERVTTRLKSFPFVITENRRWFLNFEDYNFQIKDDVLEKIQ